jgi:hypothetical protein
MGKDTFLIQCQLGLAGITAEAEDPAWARKLSIPEAWETTEIDRYGEAPPVAGITEEKVMRQQIALQLHNAANHAHIVEQEAVTADEKETDIRLRATASDQQTTIELKIGDGGSGRDLRDTIKNHLVTKYMAADSCRSGCLLGALNGGGGNIEHGANANDASRHGQDGPQAKWPLRSAQLSETDARSLRLPRVPVAPHASNRPHEKSRRGSAGPDQLS